MTGTVCPSFVKVITPLLIFTPPFRILSVCNQLVESKLYLNALAPDT